jgi:hypothetical protein
LILAHEINGSMITKRMLIKGKSAFIILIIQIHHKN